MGHCYFPPIHIWAQHSRENQGAMLRIITSDMLVVVRGSPPPIDPALPSSQVEPAVRPSKFKYPPVA